LADRKRSTWIQLAVHNAGIRKAMKALLWAYCWELVRADLGYDPSAEEVADWWNEPVRTAYREQAAFREAFPDMESPALMFENAAARRLVLESSRLARRIDPSPTNRRLELDSELIELGLFEAPT
jgi:hypothetical protein